MVIADYKPSLTKFVAIAVFLFVFIPLALGAGYFVTLSYKESISRAEQSVDWQVQATKLDLKNQLLQLSYEVQDFASSQVIGEVAVNILYSQFALIQLQNLVSDNELVDAAFIADGSDFIVEGYPFETLKIDSDYIKSEAKKMLSTTLSEIKPILLFDKLPPLNEKLKNAQEQTYLMIMVPLKKKLDSLITPSKITSGLVVIINPRQLIEHALDTTQKIPARTELLIDGQPYFTNNDSKFDSEITRSGIIDLDIKSEFKKGIEIKISNDKTYHLDVIYSSMMTTLTSIIAILVIVLLTLMRFTKKMSEPLSKLISLSRRFAAGNYRKSNYQANFQEYSELIVHMNTMADTIQSQLNKLEFEKQRAEQSEKLKARFLANMSHEIRTPLNGILGLLRMVEQTKLEPQSQDWMSDALMTSKMLLNIVNDILDFSKIEEGRVEIEHTKFNLTEVVNNIVQANSSSLKNKAVKLVENKASNLDDFWIGDPTRISQILMNLLSNAIKFTEQGEVKLTIGHKKVANKHLLSFEIKDSGIGIAKENLGLLFDSFRQADVSTTRKHGGTGLGLAIAKRLAQLMGGDIAVESEIGVGSTFTATIAVMPTSQIHEADKKEKHIPDLSQFTILVAEDNRINATILKHLLTPTKANIIIVENGLLAVEKATNSHVDLILMDVQMPEMDGLEATKVLRKKGFEQPIIMQTANVLMEEVENYIEGGANAHLAKPIIEAILFKVLEQNLLTSEEGDEVI